MSVWCLHSQTTLKSHTELLKLHSFVKSIFLLVFLLYMVLACKHVDTRVSKGQTISGVLISQPCLETERTPEQEADQQALRILPSLCMSRFFTWVLGILTQVLTLRLTLPSPFFIFTSCKKRQSRISTASVSGESSKSEYSSFASLIPGIHLHNWIQRCVCHPKTPGRQRPVSTAAVMRPYLSEVEDDLHKHAMAHMHLHLLHTHTNI